MLALSPSPEGAYFLEVIYLKKIKLFFVRNYQRFIRFLISLSAVSALILGQAFSTSAITYIDCVYSPPILTGNNCYAEIITSNNWHWLVYVEVTSLNSPSVVGDVAFRAFIGDTNYLRISADVSSVPSAYIMHGYYVDMSSGNMVMFETYNDTTVQTWIKSAGTITGFHGYNCRVGIPTATQNDFVVNYGNDIALRNALLSIQSYIPSISQSAYSAKNSLLDIKKNIVDMFNAQKAFFGSTNMDQILKAIQDNKSSAEKNIYSGATDDHKKAQSDLDSSEKKISEDTAEARASTINIFKSFSIVGDIAKGMLAVTNLFNVFTGDLVFAPALLNFSLSIGAGAFLLGLSAIILKVVHFKE